jgi:hypothetical protein
LPIANGQIANWQPKIFISMKNSNLALIRIGPWATLLPHHKRYIKRWPWMSRVCDKKAFVCHLWFPSFYFYIW